MSLQIRNHPEAIPRLMERLLAYLFFELSLRGPCNGPWQSLTVAAEVTTIREVLPFLKCHCEACVSRLWQSLTVAGRQ